jgi:hypothetical protein
VVVEQDENKWKLEALLVRMYIRIFPLACLFSVYVFCGVACFCSSFLLVHDDVLPSVLFYIKVSFHNKHEWVNSDGGEKRVTMMEFILDVAYEVRE